MIKRLHQWLESVEHHSTSILRIGLGGVFVYFGLDSVLNPLRWVSLVPSWIANIVPAEKLVQVHGLTELLLGTLLIGNVYTALVAFFLSGLLLTTSLLVAGPTRARDLGLLAALISLIVARFRRFERGTQK